MGRCLSRATSSRSRYCSSEPDVEHARRSLTSPHNCSRWVPLRGVCVRFKCACVRAQLGGGVGLQLLGHLLNPPDTSRGRVPMRARHSCRASPISVGVGDHHKHTLRRVGEADERGGAHPGAGIQAHLHRSGVGHHHDVSPGRSRRSAKCRRVGPDAHPRSRPRSRRPANRTRGTCTSSWLRSRWTVPNGSSPR